jgi:hypothetical protein
VAVAEALGGFREFVGPRTTAVRAELELEYDNLHAALRWSIQNGQADLAMRIICTMMRSTHPTQRSHRVAPPFHATADADVL